jgi:NADH-quinone oxidoreductase subunit J
MILQAVAFYLFSVVAVVSAFLVIASRNPVHSVLYLILTFFSAAGLFVLLGAEFLAMILIVVYVGAVMVLFLFVVMMLDVDFAELKRGAQQYLVPGLIVGGLLAVELIFAAALRWTIAPHAAMAAVPPAGMSNTAALGHLLYTDYIYYFQVAGLVLLVAMIGAIVLTLRKRTGVRKQSVPRQVARTPQEAMVLVDVEPGQGA